MYMNFFNSMYLEHYRLYNLNEVSQFLIYSNCDYVHSIQIKY